MTTAGTAQNVQFGCVYAADLLHPATVPNGGFACACPFADSHGPLRVALSDTAVDRPVRIGQDGGAVSSVVIDRSRMVLMERCRLILR